MSQKYGDAMGVRYIQYVGNKLVTKEKWFKSEAEMTKFLDKLEEQGKLHQVLSFSREPNPLRPRLSPYTGRELPRANPGAQWHEHQASLAKLRQLESKHQPDKNFDLGQEIAHLHSQAFSKNLGIPNPLTYGPTGFRPPRAWFRKMMENVARGYRKPSAMTKAEFTRAVARIVGGIWARFRPETRTAIVRKYERS